MNELEEALEADDSEQKLSDICIEDTDGYSFPSFAVADCLSSVLTTLKVMFRDCPNHFFSKSCERLLSEATKTAQSLSLDEMVDMVWEPAFEHCLQISDSLIDRSMALNDVNRHFAAFEGGKMQRFVHDLVCSVGMCLGKGDYYQAEQVDISITSINNYMKVLRCSSAASVLLTLKEELELQGDFDKAEKVKYTVSLLRTCCGIVFYFTLSR